MAEYRLEFSTNASQTVKELQSIIASVAKVEKVGGKIAFDLDTSRLSAGIDATFRKLNKQIENSQRILNKLQIGGPGFQKVAGNLGTRQGLRERGRAIAEPIQLRAQSKAFEEGSLIRFNKELQALQIEASQIKPNSQEWASFQQQIGRIQGELKKVDQAAEAIQLRENLGAFAPGSLDRLSARLRLLKIEANAISPSTDKWKQVNNEIKKTEESIQKINKKPLSAGQRAGAAGGAFLYGGGLGGGAGSALGGIAGGLAGGVPGAFAGAAVGQLTDNLIAQAAAVAKISAEYNKSRIALAGVTSSQADFNKALDAASSIGQKFLLPITNATQQFTKLQASVRGAGYDTETTVKAFNGISSAIIATGGSTEDLNGALLAVSQVFSKGKVSAEELRQQIGERLAGAFTIFADSSGIAAKELDKLLSKGEVTLDDFVKFLDELGKRYGTTADLLASAPENAGPRLAVAIQSMQLAYGGFFQRVGAGFQAYATDLINFAIANQKGFQQVVATVAVAAQDIYNIFSGLIDTLIPPLTSFFKFIFENFARGINALSSLADESRRAAGGPEKRAQAAVDKAFAGRPLEGYGPFGGERFTMYKEALDVELAKDTKGKGAQKTQQKRIDEMMKNLFAPFQPSKFGSALSTGGPKGGGPGAIDEEKKKKADSLESYYSLQDQLAKAQTQADIDRLEAEFEHARAMINAEYDLKEARANSFQKKAIAFQKEIFAITSEQDAALFKNRNKVLAAAGSVAGGAGLTMGGVVATTGGAVNQDPLTRGRSTGAHLHAQAAGITEKTLRYLVDKYLEIGGKTASAFGQSRGSAGHGYNAIDFLTPQNTPIKLKPGASMSQYGPAGGRGGLMSQVTTPEGSFQLGHLSSLTLGGRGAAPGKVTGDVKRDKLAEQQVALTVREANAANIEKEAEAIAKLQIATANYVQSLVPTTEQALQNQLLQQRITLTRNSFSPDILEAQLTFAKQELETAENIRIHEEEISKLMAAGGKNVQAIKFFTDANNQLKASLPVSAIQLYTQAINDQVLSLVQRAQVAGQDAANQEKINDLIIGGMTRQAAEAKVTADNLRDNYKKALEEATRQVEIAAAAEEVLAAARRLGGKETEAQTAQYNALAKALKDAKDAKDKLEKRAPEVAAAATGIETSVAPKTTKGYLAEGLSEAQENLDKLTNTGYQVIQGANAIGDAFGSAFKNIASGSMTAQQALATMFQSIADHFLDMAAQMIAAWIKMAILNTVIKIFGGTLTTAASPEVGAIGQGSSIFAAAEGAYWPGGFQAFADGGLVTKPTMGLIGEGGESEYVIPSSKMESAMARYSRGARGESVIAGSGGGGEGGTATAAAGPMVVDVRYNVERINEVEYVTASQFQAGMRQAAQQGASQGEQRTLRRLQQSPGTRKRVGM